MARVIIHPTIPPRQPKTIRQQIAEGEAASRDESDYEVMLAEEYRAGDTLPDPPEGFEP